MENAKNLEEFQAKIDAETKIEPKDWMPDEYRQHLVRQMSQHAHSEVIGMGSPDDEAPMLELPIMVFCGSETSKS